MREREREKDMYNIINSRTYLLQVHDFSVSPLSVRGIAKGVEALFESHCGVCFLIYCFPYHSVGLVFIERKTQS